MIIMLGWIGSVLLMLCSLPQLIKMLQTKNVESISPIFLFSWLLGMIFMLLHVILIGNPSIPIVMNYSVSLFVVISMIVTYLKYK